MLIEVRISDGRLARYARALAEAGPRGRQEMARGLNEGGDRVRTLVRRALRDQTGVIKYGTVVANTVSIRAAPGRLEYRIRGEGPGLPIEEFKTSVRDGKGGGVVGQPWRIARQFKRSFRQQYRGGLMARLGPDRFPIRRLRGPNLAHEIVEGESLQTFDQQATAQVMRAMTRRLARIFPNP